MPNQVKDLHKVDETSFPYIFEQNATVTLKAGDGLVRCNIYRPKSSGPVPVLVTYGPYGKDIPYKEYLPLGSQGPNLVKLTMSQLPPTVLLRGQ
ncbi:hypothetical protein HYQ46_000487 [Verticillium longisporum]|nr:hypothetical protein HYQ46_000487 [Verticillium longisporum]